MADTITGVHKYTLFRTNGYAVCKFKTEDGSYCIIVGDIPETANVKITFSGTWVNDKQYGKQFRASSYAIRLPEDKSGIISYLIGLHCGVGKTWAKRIYDKFGAKTWDVLEHDPEQLLRIRGFGKKRLLSLKEKMTETQATRDVMALFDGVADISMSKAAAIVKTYGHYRLILSGTCLMSCVMLKASVSRW